MEVENLFDKRNATDTLSQFTEVEKAEKWMHRSIHVTPRFRNRLAEPDEYFLEYLRCHYLVLVYLEDSRKKNHVKGTKETAEECNLLVRALLAKWRRG